MPLFSFVSCFCVAEEWIVKLALWRVLTHMHVQISQKHRKVKKQNCIFTVKLILYCNLATKLLNIFPREFRAMVVWVPYFSFFLCPFLAVSSYSAWFRFHLESSVESILSLTFKNEEFRFWLKHNLQSWAWKQSWHVFTIFIISLRSLTFMLCGLAFIHIVVF